MKLAIVSSFPDFSRLAPHLATNEEHIDFRRAPEQALRCTLSFAALELKRYLKSSLTDANVFLADHAETHTAAVEVACEETSDSFGAYRYEYAAPNQLRIIGLDRNGVINGVYAFLKHQGWRWYFPGADGEFAPEGQHSSPCWPPSGEHRPSFQYRAFYFEFPSQENIELLDWMARNGMNVFGGFPSLAPRARKYGMFLLSGGHIFDAALSPSCPLPGGGDVFSRHPEWYGVRADGSAATRDNCTQTQFCCTNPALADYLAETLVMRLTGAWREADIVEVSGFDAWGSTCQCPSCRRLDGDTDKYLHLMSALRERLNKAVADGRLDRPVGLNSWAYEGTATQHPPVGSIPSNLTEAGDNNVAFVINRCYRHAINDSACECNRAYANTFRDWGRHAEKLCLWAGEYYNVSRYVDLPLLFPDVMTASIRFYHETGARGLTYMHVPVFSWGFRAVTNNLHALLGWDCETDTDTFFAEYLQRAYGPWADAAREAYALVTEASADIADWRNWCDSVLCALLAFDSEKPATGITTRHLANAIDRRRSGVSIRRSLRRAMELLRVAFEAQKDEAARTGVSTAGQIMNPEQSLRLRQARRRERKLAEDMAQLRYGYAVLEIETLCCRYLDEYLEGRESHREQLWAKIERRYTELSTMGTVEFRAAVPFVGGCSVLDKSLVADFILRMRRERMRTLQLENGVAFASGSSQHSDSP